MTDEENNETPETPEEVETEEAEEEAEVEFIEPLRLHPDADPLPEAVQRLREHVLPAYGESVDDLIRAAVRAVRADLVREQALIAHSRATDPSPEEPR